MSLSEERSDIKSTILPSYITNYLPIVALLLFSPILPTLSPSYRFAHRSFDMERVNPSGAVFDMDKLKWVNSQHLKAMTVDEVAPLVRTQLVDEGVIKESALGTGEVGRGAKDGWSKGRLTNVANATYRLSM